jgi:hypothetical protein
MPNIYLFSYCGGHGGDFLCRQISQDPNYYPSLYKETTDNFRWVNDNPFDKYDLNFKRITSEIDKFTVSDSIRDQIDKEYNQKHLIVPAHNMTQTLPNLPRVKRMKLVSIDSNAYFYYTLLCIKAWRIVYDLKIHQRDMIPRFAIFKDIHKDKPALLEKIESIENRGYVYSWEMHAIYTGLDNGIDVIKQHYPIYQKYNRMQLTNSINLDLDAMYAKPDDNVKLWSSSLDMQTILDANIIAEYNQKNIDLIESNLNRSINQYNTNNWLEELTAWVKSTCPSSY